MKEALRRAGLRTLVVTFTLAFGLASGRVPSAQASPTPATAVYYDTWGSVGNGSGPITFIGEGSSATPGGMSFISPGSFLLGQFQVGSLPSSANLTYNNTPFQIFAQFSSTPGGPFSTVELDGTLNGTISGNTGSTMFATVTSIQTEIGSIPPPFPLSALLVNMPQAIAPYGINGGLSTLAAQIILPQPVPEPGSMAVFVAALGGLGLWHRRRAS